MTRPTYSKVYPYRRHNVNTFHRSLSSTILLAQLFGLFPVRGVLSDDSTSLRYSWCSLGTATSITAIAGTGTMTVLGAYWCLLKMSMFRATKVVFYGSAVVSCVLLHRLGCSWPRLARVWRDTELATSHIGYPDHTVLYCRIFSAIYFIVAVGCSSKGIFRQFFSRWFPQLLTVVTYSPLLGPPVLLFNTIATFTFSYLDLLIINITFCLSGMFKQYNTYILQAAEQEFPRPIWRNLHRDYQMLRGLVQVTDQHISYLVLLSFIINLYHICLQLYLSFTPLPTVASKVYFCLSFGFLMMRTITVCFSAASIHDEAVRPKYVLFSVPPEEYCDEVERFLFQVCNDKVAISGLKFFILTRKTLLTVIGLAITYEIVMFQVQTMAEEEDDVKRGVLKNITVSTCE